MRSHSHGTTREPSSSWSGWGRAWWVPATAWRPPRLEAAPILDTAAALGAEAILCVRASEADERPRHRGPSHHTDTVLDLLRTCVTVPIVPSLSEDVAAWRDRHRVVEIADVDAAALLDAAGLRVTTMGRGPDVDRLFFDTAAAAGIAAVGG